MNSRKSFHREVKMMIAEGFTCQRYGFNVGADKFSLLTIENGKTSIMRLSEWTLISQSQKSHSDRLLGGNQTLFACDPERPGGTGFIRRSSTFICRTSQSAQARCSGGKERMGALERGVSALHQAGTGKCLSGNQASGGMDLGDISQEKTTKERRGRACLENRNTGLFGKQRIHQAFS